MESVNITTAKALVKSGAVTRAVIQSITASSWAIVLRGSTEFVLKSERKNPKPFMKIETALAELRSLGLRYAEIDFVKWEPAQKTLKG